MTFPTDEITLANIEHALGARLHVTEEGETVVVGADFSLPKLLEFLSGYDESLLTPRVDEDGYEVPGWVEYPNSIYSRDDMIGALINEIRRLRGMLR